MGRPSKLDMEADAIGGKLVAVRVAQSGSWRDTSLFRSGEPSYFGQLSGRLKTYLGSCGIVSSMRLLFTQAWDQASNLDRLRLTDLGRL